MSHFFLAQIAQATQNSDIRDVPDLILVENPPNYFWWLILFVIIILLAFIVYKLLHKRAKQEISPFELAMLGLKQAKENIKNNESKSFGKNITLALRQYLTKEFSIDADAETTEELTQSLNNILIQNTFDNNGTHEKNNLATIQQSYLNKHKDDILLIFKKCDEAKFAKRELTTKEMENLHSKSYQFVLNAKQLSSM